MLIQDTFKYFFFIFCNGIIYFSIIRTYLFDIIVLNVVMMSSSSIIFLVYYIYAIEVWLYVLNMFVAYEHP